MLQDQLTAREDYGALTVSPDFIYAMDHAFVRTEEAANDHATFSANLTWASARVQRAIKNNDIVEVDRYCAELAGLCAYASKHHGVKSFHSRIPKQS